MRISFHIDLHNVLPCAARCAALAVTLVLIALPSGANAQEPVSASSVDTGSATLASVTPAAAATSAPVADNAAQPVDTRADSSLAGEALSIPADAAATTDLVLDDKVLSQQRGGFGGMLMVATTPQLMRGNGNSVTLWDEIAPPSPLPVPVDVAHSAQGNVTTYQRKQ
ncbi:hypothetical protein R75461_08336 [Paraburkholderia nemoris]|uniref:hypothetical protein n=1 Tax=Paraburkholderia nemoris TaxID=2793076 RepID=UPI00190A7BB2|nr:MULTISPECIES: hypothetical protein [Paraburkholderia]MBK3787048.1 hypothetical protein [Paraburkholderia aspalathi]CAE6866979.1 hypothetical protein R75461_08336 [Paraburkholderia nemoris]